jgi:hypothetical protein
MKKQVNNIDIFFICFNSNEYVIIANGGNDRI